MKPVWMVRSRQVAQKLSFWLMIIGYDPRDTSLGHRIYLIYASVFMSLWAFAMLSLAAGATASLLVATGYGSANQAAVEISLLILVIWCIYQLWEVSRHSPFVFSEEDAYLICQTPANRSIVALNWFVGDWFIQALPFWAIGVIFGFALVESQLAGKVEITDLFRYVFAGLRALSLIMPLHLGLLAFLWALGALRLQGKREWRWLPRVVTLGILLAASGLIWSTRAPEVIQLSALVGQVILWPIHYSLQAAFSIGPWPNGWATALGVAITGLLALALAGENLNLGRAAQESTQREKLQTAQRYGITGLVREIQQRNRLGIGRDPTRLPARPGPWVLLWKDTLQARYEMGLGGIWGWITLLGISSGVFLAPDSGARILIFVFWLIAVGNRTTSRLRADLPHWWMLRSLPFHAESLLLMELAIPWCLTVLIGWLAISVGGAGLGIFRVTVAVLIPSVCLLVSLISTYDLLRQSTVGMLLNGNVPGISWLTLLASMLCLAILAGVIWRLSRFPWAGISVAYAVSCLFAYGVWRVAAHKYRSIS